MRTAILILNADDLSQARALRGAIPGGAIVYGPSCVVGPCRASSGDGPGVLSTDDAGLFGWSGPLRGLVDRLWGECDALIALMPLDTLVRLIGPMARDRRDGPAVVSLDRDGRFAVGVLRGRRADVETLGDLVSKATGARSVPAASARPQGRGNRGGPSAGA